MPKVRFPSERAVQTARRIVDEAGLRRAHRIDVEALAAHLGAMSLYAPMTTARGMMVRTRDHAIIHIDERARWEAWARFTIAHELGHFLMHANVDHFAHCTAADEPRGDGAWDVEGEANDFASELLIPEADGAPLCAVERAEVDHVARLSERFGTSFVMSAIRFVELTMAPCAVVAAKDGTVQWALESLTFPGAIAKWRPLDRGSVAARLSKRVGADAERKLAGGAWKSDVALVERAWRTGEGRTLSWIGVA